MKRHDCGTRDFGPLWLEVHENAIAPVGAAHFQTNGDVGGRLGFGRPERVGVGRSGAFELAELYLHRGSKGGRAGLERGRVGDHQVKELPDTDGQSAIKDKAPRAGRNLAASRAITRMGASRLLGQPSP